MSLNASIILPRTTSLTVQDDASELDDVELLRMFGKATVVASSSKDASNAVAAAGRVSLLSLRRYVRPYKEIEEKREEGRRRGVRSSRAIILIDAIGYVHIRRCRSHVFGVANDSNFRNFFFFCRAFSTR